MANSIVEALESLHTAAIDARNGYREALEDADAHGMTGLFADMIALHTRNAGELAAELAQRGAPASYDGSIMTAVNRTIMSIRGLFGALDQSVLPGLIDGEERNEKKYDEALRDEANDGAVRDMLTAQRQRITASIARMRMMQPSRDTV